MIILCGIICILATLPIITLAGRRVRHEGDTLTWTLLALSLMWTSIYVCGFLRLQGTLPPVGDELTTREITNFMGTTFAPLVILGFTICSVIADALLMVLVCHITEKNKVWWILGSLVAFLGGLLLIACIGYVMTGGMYSIDMIFFGGCCASMALPGWALGFSYKEICVIVNIYLEAALCVVSAMWLVKVLLQRVLRGPSIVNRLLFTIGACYLLMYIAAFIGIVAYYPPPLDAAFDKCYRDLVRWAVEYGSTYNNVNYVIFIVGFLIPVGVNCVLAHLLLIRKDNDESKTLV